MTTDVRRPTRKRSGESARPRTSAQERFEHRLSARRRRTWKLVLAVVLLAALGAGAWWVLWRSDWLLVEQATVTGVEAKWESHILAAADPPISQPLVEVDTGAMAAAVREVSVVKDVVVSRSWPHTVAISVTPREPVLGVRQSSGRVALVDDEGAVVETVADPPEGMPMVVTSGSAGATAEAYRTAWGVVSALPAAIADQVTEVTVSSADLVTLTLGERTIVWGGAQDAELKAQVAAALLRTEAVHIDVSAPRSPVTRGE